jgi:tRNA threonylcarbamoyladenosine biosynthesis protein TsaB
MARSSCLPSERIAIVLTLAIETSGLAGSLALFDEAACLAEMSLELGVHHGQSLVPELRRLFDELGRTPGDCDLLAVSTGPGSFTGLRVGVVCAKTWAYVTGCRLVAVDTHQAIAANTPEGISVIHVVSEAQRGDVYFTRFGRTADRFWAALDPMQFLPAEEWLATLRPEETVSGPGLVKLESRIAGRCGILDRSFWLPKAGNVAQIGRNSANRGDWADPWTLEPHYVRRSSAEEKWDLRKRP